MYYACRDGNRNSMQNLIKKGNDHWNMGLYGACSGGHKDLALLMIEKGANDWNWALSYACDGGHKDLVLLMIEKGANDWNLALNYACIKGHKDLVLLMIETGADINKCYLLDEFDIDYLLDKKVKEFGKFKELANLCIERRKLADKIFKELNLRDVDSVICTY